MTVLETFLAEVRPQLPDSPLLPANAHPFVTTALHGFGNEALAAELKLAARRNFSKFQLNYQHRGENTNIGKSLKRQSGRPPKRPATRRIA